MLMDLLVVVGNIRCHKSRWLPCWVVWLVGVPRHDTLIVWRLLSFEPFLGFTYQQDGVWLTKEKRFPDKQVFMNRNKICLGDQEDTLVLDRGKTTVIVEARTNHHEERKS